MKIWVSGSIARDVIMDFPGRFRDFIDPKKIHVLNVSFAVENLKENHGGTAANICYNLALLGERPIILGGLGREGVKMKKRLEKLGVSTKYIRTSSLQTATAYIITDKDDNQITGFHAGAMNEQIKKLPQVKEGDWAIIAAENPKNMVRLAKHYQRHKINYIFDPGQQITALANSELRLAIRGSRVLIGNDYEIGQIIRNIGISKYPELIVVRTFGPKGSEIYCDRKKIQIGIAKPRRVVDPTGAGDAYRAGFLKGLILGYDMRSCAQLGAIVASFVVEEYGTQNHRFNLNSVWKRHKLNFKHH